MKKKILFSRFLVAIACIGLLVSVVTFAGLPQAEVATTSRTYTGIVSFVQDGDTISLQQPLNAPSPVGSTVTVRLVGMDAPETFTVAGHLPGNQVVHGEASRSFLQSLLPSGTVITVVTDQLEVDSTGRVLGHVYRGSLSVNRELLRQGHAVTYVRWPNTYSRFNDFRSALLEGRTAGRGMWNPANPIQELPFEYRLRVFGRVFAMFVGDFSTKTFVSPANYRSVPVENRVKFRTEQDAISAGYRLATTAPTTATVVITEVDLIGERVVIANRGQVNVDVSGWVLVSEIGNQRFTFPLGTVIPAGSSITVVSGPNATAGPGRLVWTRSHIWNNNGDPAVLLDSMGREVSRR